MFDAASVYGANNAPPSYGVAAPTQAMGTDDIASGWRGLIDPNNPLSWLGGIILVTFGLAGFAGSIRLGRAKFSAAVDQT